jgi:hypothetical protein
VNAPSIQTPKLLIAKKKREPTIRDWLLVPPAARQKINQQIGQWG